MRVAGRILLAGAIALGLSGGASAALIPFEGTLSIQVDRNPPGVIAASGGVGVTVTGTSHLGALTVPASAFGPANLSILVTASATINSIRFTSVANAAASFPSLSGGPPGGGPMGLTGLAKICLVFDASCVYVNVPVPLTPTTGGVGIGIGGTAHVTGAVSVTLQHAPWTVGQPVMTIHRAGTSVTTPALPAGSAHGPASATSSTAQPGSVLQLVTATKAWTALVGTFPEVPITAAMRVKILGNACEDTLDNDGDGLSDWPDDPGCDSAEDDFETSPALICDNGEDDDEDGLIDSQDLGCDDPLDPSEQSALIDCDDGNDNDGDGLIDTDDPGCDEPADASEQSPLLTCDDGEDDDSDGLIDLADPGCDDLLDPFEENCGIAIRLTDNASEDTAPDVSNAHIVWQQWDGSDFEVMRWDESSVTPLTDNAAQDMAPSIDGANVAWQEWSGGDSRIMVQLAPPATPLPLTGAGVSGWAPDAEGSDVVWSQAASLFDPPERVYRWNGSSTLPVTDSDGGDAAAVADGTVAWEGALGIQVRTGSTTALIPGSAGGRAPAIWASRVVWHASDGNDDEVFLWNGSITQQLTDNATDDRNPDLFGNRVVWEAADGIRVWKNGDTFLVPGSTGGQSPRIDGFDVVWQTWDGSDNEIWLTTVCAACNDGADNEGDGKIDYDGGLSALGYIAADPDPQCGSNPWKDKETNGPCGLGFELAFLLPGLMWLRRRRRIGVGGCGALALLIALAILGAPGSAEAAPQPFDGTLTLTVGTYLRPVEIQGEGTASISPTGISHLASAGIPASVFGPAAISLPVSSAASTISIRFTGVNLSGTFSGFTNAPPAGGTMGISGLVKLCMVFDSSCNYVSVDFPLTPTGGGAGFGIGGTAHYTGLIDMTLQHAPWTVGQPAMTIHNWLTTITTPLLPAGSVHGPASGTSSTAEVGGVLQLVTATKAYTSLTHAFPEVPVTGVVRIELVLEDCQDGKDNDGDGLIDHPADPGCDAPDDDSEQSAALVCDNGEDDDGDGLIDSQDPGCDDPEDPSEKAPGLACDNGLDDDGDGLADLADPGCSDPFDSTETDLSLICDDGQDNDADGLVDAADPGCDDPLDVFEENCGVPIRFTDNATEDAAPATSKSRVVWQQWDGIDFELVFWDGATAEVVTLHTGHDLTPTIHEDTVVSQLWTGSSSRIIIENHPSPGGGITVLSSTGAAGWAPDMDDVGVVWSEGPSLFGPSDAVFYWERGTNVNTAAPIPLSAGGDNPATEDGTAVWETAAGIHMWTGAATTLIPGSAGGHKPEIWGSRVAWHASDGNDDEIFLWNGSSVQQLTDNATDDRNADLSGSRVVWESADGIQLWKNGTTSLIAGSTGGKHPRIDGLDVVWQASDGSDNEIWLVTVCAACNDGVDNEGDGKIDYDGGLSALGYIAAAPDPQCNDNPWKDKEKSGSCGLGYELAFLLPGLMWLRRKRGLGL